MSKKSELTGRLLDKIQPQTTTPAPLENANLLEQGLYAVLLRRVDDAKARAALKTLKEAYADWNELRVAQAQEIADHVKLGAVGIPVARDVRAYLQEVFQRSHGMDLEFLRDDAQTTMRFVSQLPFIGMGTAHYLMWVAGQKELPVSAALVRVLDRIGMISRTASVKKARAAIEPLVGDRDPLDFAIRFGEVASRWCDVRKPLCHLCVLVEDCRYGKKAYREWKVQQERLEVQRAREAARAAILQKKEDERRRKEDERRRKKQQADAERAAREAEKRARIDAKKRAIEDEKAAREKARQDAQRKREEERQRAKAQAEAKKQAAREAAAKKIAAKAAAKAKAVATAKSARLRAKGKSASRKPGAKSHARAKPKKRSKSR